MDSSTTTTEPTFENSDLTVSVHRKPASRVELHVRVSSPIAESAWKEAVKSIVKEVSLPGFRKGKSPAELVIKRYPREIDQRWQEEIASKAMQEAEKLTKVSPISRSTRVSYTMKTHSLTGAELSISFEAEPAVPDINPQDLKLTKVERPTVNDEKVEETIRQVRFFFAAWNDVEDRAVEIGDYVLLDVEDLEQTPPKKVFSHTRFEVTEKSMAKWMLDLVLGKKKGDCPEGLSTPDEDLPEEEKSAFQPKKVRLHLLAIQQAILPELDETLAKNLGADHVQDLRTKIDHLLNQQADAHVKEKLREQVSEQLLALYPFDLPFTLVERETQFRMRHLLQDPQFQQQWAKMDQSEHQKTILSIFDQSQKAVRMFYLCRKFAGEKNIQVTPKDLPTLPSSALETLLQPSSSQPLISGSEEIQQAEAFSRLLLEKTEDYLISQADIS